MGTGQRNKKLKTRLQNADLRRDTELRKQIIKRAMRIASLFDEANKTICRFSILNNKADEFFFNNSLSLEKKVDKVLSLLSEKMQEEIEAGERAVWVLSTAKNILLTSEVMTSMNLSKSIVEKWVNWSIENTRKMLALKGVDFSDVIPVSTFKEYGFPVGVFSQNEVLNPDGLTKHLKSRVGGRSLSDRVWNITEQFKEEMELALDIALSEGKSAVEVSRDVRKLLREPNKLFRRVRDKHGVLRLSKAAKAYHPGQGVYRSSYKNAMRLVATEINMAYRTADYERWQKMPYVIGIEVNVSNNHPVSDICDELKGVYPKEFKFVGWHPQCHCFAVPVLPPKEQFIQYQNMKLAGKDVSGFRFDGKVMDVPNNFKTWFERNKNRIERAKSLPYFIRDNKELIGMK